MHFIGWNGGLQQIFELQVSVFLCACSVYFSPAGMGKTDILKAFGFVYITKSSVSWFPFALLKCIFG